MPWPFGALRRDRFLPAADERAAERVDVAGAEREHEVAVAQRGRAGALGALERRHPGDGPPARRRRRPPRRPAAR